MTRAISLHHVSKRHPRAAERAVDDLSLSVRPGEFLVVLGPSGCGKSTVLRMIAGLEDITEGELLLDGEYANDIPPRERDVAMVFQSFALYPNMTNRENIGFPLSVKDPQGNHDPRVEATARMLGIEDLLDRFPPQLSGGERQRVAMGRAISRRPSTFLMDEPLSNLDAKLRSHLRAEIAQLTAELGVTTIYVTHDQAEAMSLGHRVAVMRGGVLQQVGTPREIYALPDNVFVAAFIGTPRINLLQAVVQAPLGRRMSINLGSQTLPLSEALHADHQLLRIQQGRQIIVGLRSEAARIAQPSQARADETVLTGIVQHLEFQGHETLVHLSTGSTPAVIHDLESPRPPHSGLGQGSDGPKMLARLKQRVISRIAAPVAGGASPELPRERAAVSAGDFVVRAGADLRLRTGAQVPLLVDMARLYVFDHLGHRICPMPTHQPGLEA
ncbi:ABC transporter ATP-binding protein [Streptomyces bobili]|uniref:ABC transporter ATP-binding protein n=1 Tax=Streptomyces bobili TaxID=67280 RepID=UPI00341363B2